MNRTSGADVFAAKLASLLGSASVFTIAQVIPAEAQQQNTQVAQAEVAQAEEVPENVLITGSLIRGAAAVGVPVVNLNPRDFNVSGALLIHKSDFRISRALYELISVDCCSPKTEVANTNAASASLTLIDFELRRWTSCFYFPVLIVI